MLKRIKKKKFQEAYNMKKVRVVNYFILQSNKLRQITYVLQRAQPKIFITQIRLVVSNLITKLPSTSLSQ